MQIIDELDLAMRKQFAEQFLKIKKSSTQCSDSCSEAEKEHWS